MKTKLLLLAVSVAAFSSCSTMYKTGQTPDDVYYSPARTYVEGQQEMREDTRQDQANNYSSEDRTIRMGINDSRYRHFNNDYGYSPYSFYDRHSYFGNNYNSDNYYGAGFNNFSNNGYYYNPGFNNFSYNHYYYNPYYSPYPVYVLPVSNIKSSTPRMTNLNGYTHNYNNANIPLKSMPAGRTTTNTTSRSSALGNVLNKVFTPSTNNSNNNNSRTSNNNTTTERTYTPPPASNNNSSSSGSSSSGSSGTRITRPN